MILSKIIDTAAFNSFFAFSRKNPLTVMLLTLGASIVTTSLIIAWNDTTGSVIGALLGSTITSFVTIIGIIISNILKERLLQKSLIEKINNYKSTLRTEIHSLWDSYMMGIGNILSSHAPHAPFQIYYPVHEKYFSAYENTQDMLCILDDITRSAVINAYTKGKSLLDCYRFNNKLYDQLQYLHAISAIPGVDMRKCIAMQNQVLQWMAEYSCSLIEYHNTAEQAMKAAQELLSDSSPQ